MDKVIVIQSDNNKERFISKGFSSAFSALSFFVYERKVYDLDINDLNKINASIIFIFWSDIIQKDIIINIFNQYTNKNTIFIHCADFNVDIPECFKNNQKHYIFTMDSDAKKYRYISGINAKEYKTKFNGYKYSLTFAGNPAMYNRECILAHLIYNFGIINIFCRSYDFYKSVDEIYKNKLLNDNYLELYKASYKGYVQSAKELANIYATSKINIDLESEKSKFLNYRCLEIMASGGFLITPYNKEIIKYFDNGIDLETYKSNHDLTDKIRFYLQNLNIAMLIAEKGRKNTINNCSFYDRLKDMLKVIYGKNFSNR